MTAQTPFSPTFGLGLFTDIRIQAEVVQVQSIEQDFLIQSVDAPDYYYGNMLWVGQVPEQAQIERLENIFASQMPTAKHRTIAWLGGQVVDQDAWQAAGYTLHQTATLTRSAPGEPLSCDYVLRPLSSEQDWQQWIQMQFSEYQKEYGESYLDYVTHCAERYQAISQHGEYMGAFDGDELVAAAGLYCFDGIARFQSIMTKAAYRKQGIASALIQFSLSRQTYQQAVIVAEADSGPQRLYQKNGFAEFERDSAWMKY